ncbi:D-alanyl-D-alanine carboxypeptidase [Lunatimonas lonarensis]|uniref:D-alanyl-D-alanine carboxypeptidase n=1 Tax=Lunatimonas lonarensis TaxID=1232681 RepID=R7ZQF3_9BACT|nr:D-alanyl-D-alanine carboxypeptidase [Lunatimonas lonarensis]EON76283.1 D-alanyl-D-alanine carboxypeptidase [Lunatimonas lonarensis]
MGIKTISIFVITFFIYTSLLAQSPRERYRELDGLIGQNSFFNNHLTGFLLYDLDSQTVQFEKNSHLYFIPASTTKILTFFASLLVLGDSTTLLRYLPKGNDVVIWGTGDPSLYYPAAGIPKPKIDPFLARYKEIFFSDHNWKDEAFGYGWQWDDYNFAYSAEKSPLPLYGNLVTAINVNNRPHLSPSLFSVYQSDKNVRNVTREWRSNDFFYNPKTYNGMRAQVPFITSQKTFVNLASLEWGKVVHASKDPLPPNHFVLKGVPTRTLYKEMMLESDNFIAEQLLLQVSDEVFRELNTEKTIEYIQKTYLMDLPDKPQWVDGSGLSRHNLITPRSLVTVLEKIYRLLPDEEIAQIFPVGGRTGTLKNNYYAPTPYVIAKTGTVSNNHSLAGFIKTRSNKTYAFALMNNNYPYRATAVRREIEKVLLYIRDNF